MGDKNTKYFHQLAPYQKRKNYMDAIINEGKTYHDHKQKAKVIHDHFCQLIGRAHEQQIHFNFANIMESQGDLMQSIQDIFTIEEITKVIDRWSANKAPGPDGYTGEFLKRFKDILMPDMLHTFNHVLTTPDQTLDQLNDSYIILIPKKEGAVEVQDYKPISSLNSM
jgi:hypothetical protein